MSLCLQMTNKWQKTVKSLIKMFILKKENRPYPELFFFFSVMSRNVFFAIKPRDCLHVLFGILQHSSFPVTSMSSKLDEFLPITLFCSLPTSCPVAEYSGSPCCWRLSSPGGQGRAWKLSQTERKAADDQIHVKTRWKLRCLDTDTWLLPGDNYDKHSSPKWKWKKLKLRNHKKRGQLQDSGGKKKSALRHYWVSNNTNISIFTVAESRKLPKISAWRVPEVQWSRLLVELFISYRNL